jgi:hypothetical protein
MRNLSRRTKFAFSLPSDHVNLLPRNGIFISSSSFTMPLNSLSLDFNLLLGLSCDCSTMLKSPQIIHGLWFCGFASLICCKNSLLLLPLESPYTPMILITELFNLSHKSTDIVCWPLCTSNAEKFNSFQAIKIPPAVLIASTCTFSLYLPLVLPLIWYHL